MNQVLYQFLRKGSAHGYMICEAGNSPGRIWKEMLLGFNLLTGKRPLSP